MGQKAKMKRLITPCLTPDLDSSIQLSFSEIQTELENLVNLPNSVKIENPLNVSKFKILFHSGMLYIHRKIHFELSFR